MPITDFKMVAGKWGGLLEGITARQEDYVDLTITPDGKYDFGIYRTMGGFSGSGTLTLAGGKMEGRGERGSTTYTLYQSGAKRIAAGAGHIVGRAPAFRHAEPQGVTPPRLDGRARQIARRAYLLSSATCSRRRRRTSSMVSGSAWVE